MIMNFISLVILYLFSTGNIAPANNTLDGQNFSYLYDPGAEIEIDHNLIKQGDSTFVLLFLKMRKDVYEIGDYDVMQDYEISYHDKISYLDTLHLLSHIIKRNRNGFYFKIPIQTDRRAKYYILHFANRHNQKHYFYDIPLVQDQPVGNTSFYFTDEFGLPVFHQWINAY